MILYIDKLIYTLQVVTQEIYITDFSIDESSLCKIFEYSPNVRKISLVNCKIVVNGLIDFDDRTEYKIQELDLFGSFKPDDKFERFIQSLGSTSLTKSLKRISFNEQDGKIENFTKPLQEWGFKDLSIHLSNTIPMTIS